MIEIDEILTPVEFRKSVTNDLNGMVKHWHLSDDGPPVWKKINKIKNEGVKEDDEVEDEEGDE